VLFLDRQSPFEEGAWAKSLGTRFQAVRVFWPHGHRVNQAEGYFLPAELASRVFQVT